MTKVFQAQATIYASSKVVWDILMETQAYSEWDPYCEKIEGSPKLGETIKAYSTLNPGKAFAVKVTTLDVGRKMVWQAGAPLGLFKGVRTFTLESVSETTTEFRVEEVFSGPLLLLIGNIIPDLKEPFAAFAKGLKTRAEAR